MYRNAFVAIAVLAVCALPGRGSGHQSCGDGRVQGGEECDPGGGLYCNGDPALGSCRTGADCAPGVNCYYAHSCCKFNCEYVGQGATCDDGSNCTSDDACNQVGECRGRETDCGPVDGDCVAAACDPRGEPGNCDLRVPVGDGTPCSDGDACTVGETCTGGSCCGGSPLVCDDGLFCNGAESCDPAAGCRSGTAPDCSALSGDCAVGRCDETADACVADATNEGGPCDSDDLCLTGKTCTAGQCTGGMPIVTCPPFDGCNEYGCVPATGLCAPRLVVESRACNDCEDGADNDGDADVDAEDTGCASLARLQRFAIVGVATMRGESVRMRKFVEIRRVAGNGADPALPFPLGFSRAGACGNDLYIRLGATIDGTLAMLGDGEFAGSPPPVGVGEWFVSDGGAEVLQNTLTTPMVGPGLCEDDGVTVCRSDADCARPNSCGGRMRIDDPANPNVDRTGTHAELLRCAAAVAAVTEDGAAVAAVGAGQSIDSIRLRHGDSMTLTLGSGQQVVSVGSVALGQGATLTISGQPDTVAVIRVARAFRIGARAQVLLDGGLQPRHLLWSIEGDSGSVRVGGGAELVGTLLAPARPKIALSTLSRFTGAAYGQRIDLRADMDLRHVPFTALVK